MAEQFRVNRTFGNGPTVDRNIRTVLPPTKLMNYLRKTFLSDTTFTRNQYRQVRRSHLHSHINGPIQAFTVSDNAEPQFHILYF